MRRVRLVYAAGLLSVSAGTSGTFTSPWFLGLIPLGAGLIWAAYDLVEADDGESSSAPQR